MAHFVRFKPGFDLSAQPVANLLHHHVAADVADGLSQRKLLGASLHAILGEPALLHAAIAGQRSPLGHVEPKAWEDVMAINVTANWHLIRAMDPILRRSNAGRAVFMTSSAATHARAYSGPYSVSKAALNVLARTYAAETSSTTPVRVNLFNPGPTRTRMRAQVMPGEDPMILPTPDQVAEKILDLCLPSFSETGRLYDYPDGKFLDFTEPA